MKDVRERNVPGIIDTLTAGFDIATRRLWLIIVPVALDLYFWLGPKLSIAPLFRKLNSMLMVPPGSPSEYREMVEPVRSVLEEAARTMNLSTLLSARILGMPSLIASGMSVARPPLHAATIEIGNPLIFLGLFVVLSLVGLLIACFYLGLIAQEARDGRIDFRFLFRRVWLYWFRLIATLIVAGVGAALLALPASLVISITAFFGRGVASLMQSLFMASMIWIGIYLYFVPRSILLSEDGVLRSFVNSVQLVRLNFWSTLGLILLIFIIESGLALVWQLLLGNIWGTLAAVIGNAYVGTGLVAATFIFYRDRYAAWLQVLERRKGDNRNE